MLGQLKIFACFELVDSHTDGAWWRGDNLQIVEDLAVLSPRPDNLTLQTSPGDLTPNLLDIIGKTRLHTFLLEISLHQHIPSPPIIYQLGTVGSCQDIGGGQ